MAESNRLEYERFKILPASAQQSKPGLPVAQPFLQRRRPRVRVLAFALLCACRWAHADAVHPAAALVERAIAETRTDPDASARDAQAALTLLERKPNADLEVRAHVLLCDFYAENNRALAEQHIAQAEALLRDVKQRALQAGVRQCQGWIHEVAGDNARAQTLYGEAVRIAQETQDEYWLADALFSRGYLFGLTGHFAAGLADLRRSEALFEKIGMSQHALTVLNGIATLYNRLGDYAQAREIYQQALRIQRQEGLRREEVVTLHNLGRNFEYLAEWPEARAHYTEALAISRELNFARGEARTLRGLAAVANATGNPQEALDILQRAESADAQAPDARLRAQIQLERGIALRKLSRLDESATALHDALAVFTQADSLREISQVQAELAEVYRAQKNWRAAFEHLTHAHLTSDKLLRNQLDQRFATLKVEFDTASKEKQNLLLKRENEAQQSALEHARTARNLQAAVIALSGILLALLIALVLHQRRTSQRMKTLAMTDELTGIANRRAVLMQLEPLLQRAEPCALLIVDVDHFKSINDHHGHPAGDEALQRVTAALRAQLTPPAFMGRLGGEEFVIVLPGASVAQAATAAETFRESVLAIDTDDWLDGRRVTVSIGVATTLAPTDTASTLLHRADTALYLAKRSGRNCVRVDASEPVSDPLEPVAAGG